MLQAQASVKSQKAERYLVQLCKHFAHKVPAEWAGGRGFVDFGAGTCEILADHEALTLTCKADSGEGLERVKHILEDHVTRFGWREKLTVEWGAAEPF